MKENTPLIITNQDATISNTTIKELMEELRDEEYIINIPFEHFGGGTSHEQ